MRYSFQVPTAHMVDFAKYSDFVLALSHLVDDDKYFNTLMEIKSKYKRMEIWLDNGAFEKGAPEGQDVLIKKAKAIGASRVFMPDYLYNREATEDQVSDRKGHYGFKRGFVVQAKELDDYIESFLWALENDNIDFIGISYLACDRCHPCANATISRAEVLTYCIQEAYDMNIPLKPIHMLGLSDNYHDLRRAQILYIPDLSGDSGSPYMRAVHGNRGRKYVGRMDFNEVCEDQAKLRELEDDIKHVRYHVLHNFVYI